MSQKGVLIFFGVLLCFSGKSFAQKTDLYHDAKKPYYQALDLYYRGQYAAARPLFHKMSKQYAAERSEVWTNSDYYEARCAEELFNRDAEYLMTQFLVVHPESKWVQDIYYQLGDYNFRKHHYDKALEWMAKVDDSQLNAYQKTEFLFKRGFSNFELNQYTQAASDFYQIRNTQGDFYGPSNYYYGHIAYMNGNYQSALESFQRLTDNENFGTIVPYYIAQIYYRQQRYDELIKYATPLLDSADAKRKDEISLMVGDAYYQKGEYEAAVPYLQQAYAKMGQPTRQENYELGYALYKSKKYSEASTYLGRVASKKDSLSQLATYQMADCYVKQDQKAYARNAFKTAAEMDFDREITEDALFNYAKLAYELSFDPYDEAIKAFEAYLKKYPDSPRRGEAYKFLLQVYMATKNFDAALQALDQIHTKTPEIQQDYQICAYNRGVELLVQQKQDEAIKYFTRSRQYNELPNLTALSYYWQGEAYYREKNMEEAALAYQRFQRSPGAYDSGFYDDANYCLGYCYFKTSDFNKAAEEFRKFALASNVAKDKKADALIRTADCFMVDKQYGTAIDYYKQALDLGTASGDYASFQIAQCKGYQDDFNAKLTALESLIEKYPNSSLIAEARFEAGESAFHAQKLQKAGQYFQQVIDQNPATVYAKKALLQNGLVEYRLGNYNAAIASFKEVIQKYPSDSDSREAMVTLQNIYVELGRVDEYTQWVSNQSNYKVSNGKLDSLTYEQAENKFTAGNCADATTAFENYLAKYHPGIFAVNAHYYLGECAYKNQQFDSALVNYKFVIDQPVNDFSESALLGAATIAYNNKDWANAQNYYQRLSQVAEYSKNILEAQIGMLRCAFQLGQNEDVITQADSVLANKSTPQNIVTEAKLLKATVLFRQNNFDQALPIFKDLAKNQKGKEGAEAQYRIAQIAFQKADYKNAENEVFNLVKQFPGFEYWKTKGFILLSDVYREKKDYFQSKATLKSVIDNASDLALVNEAKRKLSEVVNLEKAQIADTDSLSTTHPDSVIVPVNETNKSPGDSIMINTQDSLPQNQENK